jgi:carboxyl-terminal processing protease
LGKGRGAEKLPLGETHVRLLVLHNLLGVEVNSPMTKRTRVLLTTFAVILLLPLSFGVGFGLCQATEEAPPQAPCELPDEFNVLCEVWDTLSQDHVDKEALEGKAAELSQGAVKGLLEALGDPYTSYLDAEAFGMEMSSLRGEFEGIGAEVTMEEGQLVVVAPIADAPAQKQGIRAGDKILEIDGESTSGLSLVEAVLRIRGPKGTLVRLLVLHEGESEPVEIEIIRAEIEITSVSSKMYDDIGYIKLSHFTHNTHRELRPVLKDMRRQEAEAIILDLRTNPGGILQVVVDVAEEFLDGGVVLYEVDSGGERQEWKVESGGLATEMRVVVLVNGYSASGSEVLAGALRDRNRAVIAGSKTFGKGSVTTFRLLEEGSALSITIRRWLTPNGHLIEGEGLSPDFELEQTGEDLIEWAINYLKAGGK